MHTLHRIDLLFTPGAVWLCKQDGIQVLHLGYLVRSAMTFLYITEHFRRNKPPLDLYQGFGYFWGFSFRSLEINKYGVFLKC